MVQHQLGQPVAVYEHDAWCAQLLGVGPCIVAKSTGCDVDAASCLLTSDGTNKTLNVIAALWEAVGERDGEQYYEEVMTSPSAVRQRLNVVAAAGVRAELSAH
jgi:hypothetical protein